MAKSVTESQDKTPEVLYFKLGSALKFTTPDGSISLNKLEGKTTGQITKENFIAYQMVWRSFFTGSLIQLKKAADASENKPEEIIDVTNYADDKNKLRRDAASYLRKMKAEDLVERIQTLTNPHLLAIMIEQESYGRNVSRRKREKVMDELKKRLETLQVEAHKKGSTMLAYTEVEDEEKTVKYRPQV